MIPLSLSIFLLRSTSARKKFNKISLLTPLPRLLIGISLSPSNVSLKILGHFGSSTNRGKSWLAKSASISLILSTVCLATSSAYASTFFCISLNFSAVNQELPELLISWDFVLLNLHLSLGYQLETENKLGDNLLFFPKLILHRYYLVEFRE